MLVGGLFHWLTLYHGVLTNIIGEDREDMLDVLNDDERFDRWLADLDARRKAESASASRGNRSKGTPVSQETYMQKFAKIHGGED